MGRTFSATEKLFWKMEVNIWVMDSVQNMNKN